MNDCTSFIKSPLRYPGGKNRAIPLVDKVLPKDFKEFREPFMGGASVFFHVKQKYAEDTEKTYWLNDLYPDLYVFWKETQKNVDAVLSQITMWRNEYPIGKELFGFLKQGMETFSNTEKAAAFFIFNRITFSGTTLSGGYSQQAFEKRFTESSLKWLLDVPKVLQKTVKITNDDYEKVVSQDGDDVFIFLDPPYYAATKSALYGRNGDFHKSFDHVRFADVMRNCPHQWLITYDNSDYIKNLFGFANIKEWNIHYGMRNAGQNNMTGQELFISNYDFKNSDFQSEKHEQYAFTFEAAIK